MLAQPLVSNCVRRYIFSRSRLRIQHCHIATAVGLVQKVAIRSVYMAPKRKADHGETPDKKPRAKSAKKEKPPAEPYTDQYGWTVVPPSLLFK